jgi:pimeloyl-ACP methyl ester carboxylesterase
MEFRLVSSIDKFFITILGRKLEVQRIKGVSGETPTLVLLHEGLGSISLWGDFPSKLAAATGSGVVVYSRYGYGDSDELEAARSMKYMHDEALMVLPEVLARLSIAEPILVGHSDGGSIALIHAGSHDNTKGLILLAPHVFVEEISVKSIAAARVAFETTDLPQKLARHHADAAKTFWGWNDIWLHADFRHWNIEEYLPKIRCPVLAIQGLDDEYGTMEQLKVIEQQVKSPVELVCLSNCRHSPHRDQPDAVLKAISRFLARN